ncbi:hypothetical protein ACI2IY_13855 [Lysobacter enzymogenes]|uniref:hypothetical protein n=1 Tax=Lysobacter enzymogenes TaxID=69 RepID=UPI00384E8F11
MILQVLRGNFADGSGATIEDIIAGVRRRRPSLVVSAWVEAGDPYWRPVWLGRFDSPELRSVLSEHLYDFAELGLVRYEADDNGDEGHRWHLLPDWIERGGNDGDGDGDHDDGDYGEPPRRDGGPPGGDGRGNGGLGEVLAHPRLFALAADDLDDAVLRALGGER